MIEIYRGEASASTKLFGSFESRGDGASHRCIARNEVQGAIRLSGRGRGQRADSTRVYSENFLYLALALIASHGHDDGVDWDETATRPRRASR